VELFVVLTQEDGLLILARCDKLFNVR